MGPDDIRVGGTYTRTELNAVFGGALYSGIVPSRTTPNVLLFSDPAEGKKFGYFDRLEGEDETGPIIQYVGEGRLGDHAFSKGNKAILNHLEDGRSLRLFRAVGTVSGTGTKVHKYLGEFHLDIDVPYLKEWAPDGEGAERLVLKFRLRPSGDVVRPMIDYMPVSERTATKEVRPALPRKSRSGSSILIEPESHSGREITRKATETGGMRRRESELVQRYQEFLEGRGHVVKRYQLTIAGLVPVFPTDLFDVTANVLYEAKGTAERNAIRLAIGQLFDYVRHIDPKPSRLAVLLPEKPEVDLQELIESVGMSLVYEDNGDFPGFPVDP